MGGGGKEEVELTPTVSVFLGTPVDLPEHGCRSVSVDLSR